MTDDLQLAVDVALATGRPLLLRGESGSGKSSLAAYVARQREWRYYEHVVTSRTQARDLLWTFDSVRKLADAQAYARSPQELDDFRYVEPQVLWWAYAPRSASRRGRSAGAHDRARLADDHLDPAADANRGRSPDHAVVLIDEVDKADPDLPNSLLVPLASGEFRVSETGTLVVKEPPLGPADPRITRHLVVVTTNEERELPQAFLRRCVIAWLPQPGLVRLVEIAEAHLLAYTGGCEPEDLALAKALAAEIVRAREDARKRAIRGPSTAEYLDALRACRALGIRVDDDRWRVLRDLVLVKRQQPGD